MHCILTQRRKGAEMGTSARDLHVNTTMKTTLPLLFLCAIPLLVAAQDAKQPAKKKLSENPAFAPVQDVVGLPRVLVIGDSISIGYQIPLRESLKGKANVHRPVDNCGPTSRG